MATILCISSFVADGCIGLQAIVPALQSQGHDVIALPTILLSNHPGYSTFARQDIPAEALTKAIEAYEKLGWLSRIDAVLTGYFPSSAHVEAAASVLDQVKRHRPDVLFICDPVLGDDPDGLYIPQSAAEAVRALLVSKADVITPNRFELEWLSGRSVTTPNEALAAARALGIEAIAATSIPVGSGRLANVFASSGFQDIQEAPRLDAVPHGTGDYFSAVLTGALVNGEATSSAFAIASSAVQRIAAASQGRESLRLTQ